MSSRHYVFAGGGTGGHLYPGLAVAAALRAREPSARITFFTTSRPLDRDLLGPTGYAQMPQTVRPFSTRPWHWPGFWLAWRRSVDTARAWLAEHQPAAVLGLGGYAAGPPVVAAAGLGIRTAILNPDAVPGRANRFLARRVDLVAVQWEASRAFFAPGAPLIVTGCPIRAAFAQTDRAAGAARFGLDPRRPVLLATGASQGARTINRALALAWPAFAKRRPEWQLLHLTGATDEAETIAAYHAAGLSVAAGVADGRGGESIRVLPFTHEMPAALSTADLVISRAGASTLAELTLLGRPSILLPYPYHRDRHQHANAQVLVDAGGAVMIDDVLEPGRNAQAIGAALERCADPVVRQMMSEGAQALGRGDAAERVAAWMAGGTSLRSAAPDNAKRPAR